LQKSTRPDWISTKLFIESVVKKIQRRRIMKRILISGALALALAGTSAFAAQNKNTGKKPAAKTSNSATMTKNTGNKSTGKGKGKRHHKRHGKGKGKSNKNM